MADLAIALEFQGRDMGASAAADKVSGSVTKVGDASEHATQKSGGLMSALGGVASVAGGFVVAQGLMALPGFLEGAAKAAAEEETGIKRLAQAVDNSGGSWETQSGAIESAIAAREKMGFADDKLRSSLAMLTAQTGSVDEAFSRQTLAMDLSRGANIDLETASKLLGKVTDDNVNVLARYGVSVEKGATQTELFAAIQQKFGGQAEATAQSAAVQWEIFQNQMGNLVEDLGSAMLPVMTQLGSAAVSFIDDLRSSGALTGIVEGLTGVFSKLGDGALAAFNAIKRITDTELFQSLAEQAASVGSAVLDTFDTLASALSAIFAGDMVSAIQTLEDNFDLDLSGITGAVAAVEDMMTRLSDAFVTAGQVIAGEWESNPGINPFVDSVGRGVQMITTTVLPALQAGVQSALDAITAFWTTHGESLTALTELYWNGIQARIQFVVETVVPFVISQFQVIADWTAANWPLIQQTIETVWTAISTVVQTVVPPIVQLITDNWSAIQTVTDATWNIISTAVSTALQVILGAITLTMQVINGDWAGAWETIKATTQTAFEGVISIIETFGGLVNAAFAGVWRAVVEGVGPSLAGLGPALVASVRGAGDQATAESGSIGVSIVQGIGAGILRTGPNPLVNPLSNLITAAMNDVKKQFGISSPSTWSAEQIGSPLAEGIIQGIVTTFGAGENAIRAVVESALRNSIDPTIALSLTKAESGFNPLAIGDSGHSVGLQQLHDQGQGAGMTVAQREDPWANAGSFFDRWGPKFAALAQQVQGSDLARLFGVAAEQPLDKSGNVYAAAYNEIVKALGPLDSLASKAAPEVQAIGQAMVEVNPKAAELAASQEKLNAVIGQGFPQSAAAGTQELKAFGSGAQILMDTLLSGNSSIDETQSAMVRLAASTGLAIAPAQQMQAGLIDQDQALKQVLASVAMVNPAYISTAAGFVMGATTSQEATLNFLQLAASTQGVTDAVIPADQALRTMAGFMPDVSKLAIDGALSGDDLTRALLGITEASGFMHTGLDIANASTDDLNTALGGVVSRMAEVDPRFKSLNDTIHANGGITDATRGDIVNLIGTMGQVPGAIDPAAAANNKFGESASTAADDSNNAWKQILSEIKTAVQSIDSTVKTLSERIIGYLDNISDTKVNVDTSGSVRSLDKLEQQAKDTEAAVKKVASSIGEGVKFVSGRAEGGWSNPGSVGWVGEQGPELSVSRGDYVLTHDEAMSIARDAYSGSVPIAAIPSSSGGGGGDTYVTANFVNHGTLIAQDGDDWLVDSLNRLDREGRIDIALVNSNA